MDLAIRGGANASYSVTLDAMPIENITDVSVEISVDSLPRASISFLPERVEIQEHVKELFFISGERRFKVIEEVIL